MKFKKMQNLWTKFGKKKIWTIFSKKAFYRFVDNVKMYNYSKFHENPSSSFLKKMIFVN